MEASGTARTNDSPLSRVQSVSRIMAGLTLAVMILATVAYAVFWLDETSVSRLLQQQLTTAGESFALTPRIWATAFTISLLPVALYLVGLCNVWLLFRVFARGQVFAETTGRRIGWIGLVIAVLPLVSILAASAWSVAASIDNPPGERELSISLSGTDLLGVLLGVLLVVIGWVIREAARIADENQSFV